MSSFERVARPNTLIVTIPEDLSGLSHREFVDKLVQNFNADEILCVQFVPRCYARVTFSSLDVRNNAFLSGVFIDSTRLITIEADPLVIDVYLEHLPVEVSGDTVRAAFTPFGSIHEIVHLHYAGTSIRNGNRLLKMSLTSDVPVNLRILRYPCRVFYKGQPRPCSICRSSGHRAFDCPLRDVCRRCRKPGHFARDCVEGISAPTTDQDPVPPAGDDANDDVSDADNVDDDDDSDDDNLDDKLASGDEEVLNSAPAPSDSPRRTRSSTRNAKAEPTASSVDVSSPVDVPSPIPVSPPDESAPSSDPDPPDIVALFKSTYSQFALLLKDVDCYSALDLRSMTRRCIREDTATPEMYRNCYYSDHLGKDVLPSMSVFPAGRPPLHADITLSPKIAPASFPASCCP